MDDYETIGQIQNGALQPAQNVLLPSLPPPELVAATDPEVELSNIRTDLCTRKINPVKTTKTYKMKRTMMVLIYTGVMVLGITAFNLGVIAGYFTL